MTHPNWIDCNDASATVGMYGYLVSTLNTTTGRESCASRR